MIRRAVLAALALGLASIGPALAGTTQNVTITVTVEYVSISLSPSTVAFGMVPMDSKTATGDAQKVTVTNDGNLAEDFGLKVSGVPTDWTLATADKDTVGANAFTLCARFIDSGSAPLEDVYTNSDLLTSSVKWCDETVFGAKGYNVAAAASTYLNFRLHAPSTVSGVSAGAQHTLTIEVDAKKH